MTPKPAGKCSSSGKAIQKAMRPVSRDDVTATSRPRSVAAREPPGLSWRALEQPPDPKQGESHEKKRGKGGVGGDDDPISRRLTGTSERTSWNGRDAAAKLSANEPGAPRHDDESVMDRVDEPNTTDAVASWGCVEDFLGRSPEPSNVPGFCWQQLTGSGRP